MEKDFIKVRKKVLNYILQKERQEAYEEGKKEGFMDGAFAVMISFLAILFLCMLYYQKF